MLTAQVVKKHSCLLYYKLCTANLRILRKDNIAITCYEIILYIHCANKFIIKCHPGDHQQLNYT